MPNLNKVMLIGRLTRDPEMKYTPNGNPVTEFSLVTNRYWSDRDGNRQEAADFHNIVVWNMGKRALAELTANSLRKGSLLYLEGRLSTRSWEGSDGQKRYRTEIIAENLEFLDSKRQDNGGQGQPQPTPSPASVAQGGWSEPTVQDIDPDDIPF